MNKSAASAASPDSVKFQAVIKSAASAASRKPKSKGPRSRGAPGRIVDGGRWTTGDGQTTGNGRMTDQGAPLDLGPLDLGFLEAAPAADLITA